MADEKICPKCPTKTVMGASELVLGIPALVMPGGQNAISEHHAYPVVAYACPKCQYVELYYVQMKT